MKRSEMIKLISESIEGSGWAPEELLSYGSTKAREAIADCILKNIQEAGMLPPYVDHGKLSEFGRGCKWEPEDECEN